jgi:hypothetical protein
LVNLCWFPPRPPPAHTRPAERRLSRSRSRAGLRSHPEVRRGALRHRGVEWERPHTLSWRSAVADHAEWMSGKSRNRLAPVLTEASSWPSDRSALDRVCRLNCLDTIHTLRSGSRELRRGRIGSVCLPQSLFRSAGLSPRMPLMSRDRQLSSGLPPSWSVRRTAL